jgi:hypothetical protein
MKTTEPKPLPKVQAGGILRTSLDNTWQTPRKILDPVDRYHGGKIPLDPASASSNPTRAARFCCGRVEAPAARGGFVGAYLSRGLGDGLGDVFAGNPVAESIAAAAVSAVRGEWPWVSGLEVRWDWPVWVNPPYGRELRPWLVKITREAWAGQEIVGLLPCARWEQRYFHRLLRAAGRIVLIQGRVAFISTIDHVAVQGNPYASMLVGWNTERDRWLECFGGLGASFEMKRTGFKRAASRAEPETPLFSVPAHG